MDKTEKVSKGFALTMATRFLTLGTATIISCLLISMAMVQFRQAKSMANVVGGRMTGFARMLSEEELTGYEGARLKGSDVVNFYRRFFQAGDAGFGMVVIKEGQEIQIDAENGLTQLTEAEQAGFCRPDETYLCRVVRNANEVTLCVEFVRCREMCRLKGEEGRNGTDFRLY